MKKHDKKKLSKSLLIGSVIFALFLSACIGVTGFTIYSKGMISRYQEYLKTAMNFVAQNADGDDLKHCIETGEKSVTYEALQDKMDDFKEASNLEYFYIIKPLNTNETDNVKYVMTAVREIEAQQYSDTITLNDLSGSEYTAAVVKEFFKYMEKDKIAYYPNRTEFGYMYSSVMPIMDSSGNAIALAAADISMEELYSVLKYYVAIVLAASILITGVFLWIQLLWMKKRVISPIQELSKAALGYVQSEKSTELAMNLPDIHTRDELETLHDALKQMSQDITMYLRNLTAVTVEKERIGAELDVANHIQAAMLPCIFPAFPERPELDIYATMIPAKEVGGDFYDFFLIDDDRLAIVMADVSGKGVPAALFMVIAKTLLKNVTQTGLGPSQVLEKVNDQLCENNEAEMFVTVWLGILEISTGKMICANAGHEYPVLKKNQGEYELIKDKHGFVLAGMEGVRYKEYELYMQPGDRLYLYTDGVVEATDAQNRLYGTDRMLEVLNRHKEVTSEQLLMHVKQDVDNFVGTAPQFDDITMFSLELLPQENQQMKKLKLKPTKEAIGEVTAFVEAEMEKNNVAMKTIAQINIAVDEVFSNIIHYASASDATIGVAVKEDVITLRFADNGRPYDPMKKQDPDVTLEMEARAPGGLGIFMVKKSMDSVNYEYQKGLNVLTLTKKMEKQLQTGVGVKSNYKFNL